MERANKGFEDKDVQPGIMPSGLIGWNEFTLDGLWKMPWRPKGSHPEDRDKPAGERRPCKVFTPQEIEALNRERGVLPARKKKIAA